MKIICYGELMIDMIAEDRGPLSDAQRFRKHAGGAAANVAAQIKKLGGDPTFLGKLGDDAFGHYLIDYMQGYGIDTGDVIMDPVRRTTVAFVGLNKENIPSYLFYRVGGAAASISSQDMNAERLRQGGLVYTSSLMLTIPQVRETTHWVLRQVRESGGITAFDMNFRPTAWESLKEAHAVIQEVFGMVDLLKINDDELDFLLGKPSDPASAGAELLERCPEVKILIITCGEKGAYLFGRNTPAVFVPANHIDAADTTGAGDSYMGAFLYAYSLCDGLPKFLEKMGRWAAAAAELTVQASGAIDAMPGRETLEAYCKEINVDLF
ncbi:MAG: carbohydrate kinase family protein [Acidithiobacillus sp.]